MWQPVLLKLWPRSDTFPLATQNCGCLTGYLWCRESRANICCPHGWRVNWTGRMICNLNRDPKGSIRHQEHTIKESLDKGKECVVPLTPSPSTQAMKPNWLMQHSEKHILFLNKIHLPNVRTNFTLSETFDWIFYTIN